MNELRAPDFKPYDHRLYPPGTTVFIALAIRSIQPRNPLAGEIVQTCSGTYNELMDQFEGSHEELVPCRFRHTIYYIPEQYVSLHQP
jgi:hypothetical protein